MLEGWLLLWLLGLVIGCCAMALVVYEITRNKG